MGSGAGVVDALPVFLKELERLSGASGDAGFVFAVDRFKVEISRLKRNHDAVGKAWKALQAAAIINGATRLVERMGRMLQAMGIE